MATEVGSILSVEELLARSKAAADAQAAGKKTGGSKVAQMIAEMESKVNADSVNLSPVARLLKQREASQKSSQTPFTEQEWYINAKVSQLRAQVQLYSNLPGLDPTGAIMKSLEEEIVGLVKSQQDKLKASQDEAAKKQEELAKAQAEAAAAPTSVETLLSNAKLRANGQEPEKALSAEVLAMLEKVRGTTVNQSA